MTKNVYNPNRIESFGIKNRILPVYFGIKNGICPVCFGIKSGIRPVFFYNPMKSHGSSSDLFTKGGSLLAGAQAS